MSVAIRPDFVPGDACHCGLEGCRGSKLSSKTGHVVGCVCRPCLGRRNRKKGHRAQATAHRKLGGTGFTPHDEESGRTYSVEVQAEVKAGSQIPRSFVAFSGLDWTRRAFSQAERAIPVGVQAYPAVYLQLPERKGHYLVVKVA
jgi:hypothetical protein